MVGACRRHAIENVMRSAIIPLAATNWLKPATLDSLFRERKFQEGRCKEASRKGKGGKP